MPICIKKIFRFYPFGSFGDSQKTMQTVISFLHIDNVRLIPRLRTEEHRKQYLIGSEPFISIVFAKFS